MFKSHVVFNDFQPDDELVQYADLVLKQIQSAAAQELPIKTELSQNERGQFDCLCHVNIDEPVVIRTMAQDPRQALDLLDAELRKELNDLFKCSHFDPTSW